VWSRSRQAGVNRQGIAIAATVGSPRMKGSVTFRTGSPIGEGTAGPEHPAGSWPRRHPRHRLAGRARPEPAGRDHQLRHALAVVPGVARRRRSAGTAPRRHCLSAPRPATGVPRDIRADLAARARADAKPQVIYHSAVLIYVAAEDRQRFARDVATLRAIRLPDEAPDVIPEAVPPVVADGGPRPFVLVKDGRQPA
jgi:hypothetical protein